MLALALVACADAQPYQQPQPYYPPPQYAVYWQPVYVPGNYYAIPTRTPILDSIFGRPRFIFVPQPQQQQQQQYQQQVPPPQQ